MVSSALLGAAAAGKDCARFICHWRIFYANNLCSVNGSQKIRSKCWQYFSFLLVLCFFLCIELAIKMALRNGQQASGPQLDFGVSLAQSNFQYADSPRADSPERGPHVRQPKSCPWPDSRLDRSPKMRAACIVSVRYRLGGKQ